MNYPTDKITLTYSLKRNSEGVVFDVCLKKKAGNWMLTGVLGGGCICSDTRSFEIEMDESTVESLFTQLSNTQVSPLIYHNHHLEEGFEELSIKNGVFCSHFVWDEDAPKEYEKLQKIGRMIQGWIKRA